VRRVSVLCGGTSPEHGVSLKSGATMIRTAVAAGFEVVPVVIGRDGTWSVVPVAQVHAGLPAEVAGPCANATESGSPIAIAASLLRAGVQVVIVGLHGAGGEDGTIQGFFETVGLAYTGPGVATSAIAMDKVFTKLMLRAAGLPTADWLDLGWPAADHEVEAACRRAAPWADAAGYPVVVKARTLGSSVGVAFAADRAAVPAAIREIAACNAGAFVEKAVQGVEVSCGVIGRGPRARALPAIEIVPRSAAWFDFASKYASGGALERVPAQVPETTEAEVRRLALRAHELLAADGITRTDMIVTAQGPVILEVNTLPGMTETSLVPQEARAAGWSLEQVVTMLVETAWARRSEGSGTSRSGRAP
jgi:D-alanine-D-alanine ligase